MKKTSFDIETLSFKDSLEEWDCFVDDSPQGCIFCRSWWLKAVCPDGFEILTLRRGDRIVAAMPLITSKKRGKRVIHMPPLTQTLGVLLATPTGESYEKRLSAEMDALNALVKAIPEFTSFSMMFHYNFTNWLPFYWAGFRQTTRYTYVIEDLTDLNKVFSEFDTTKRRDIKKAERLVSVREDLSASDFYENLVLTLDKKGERIVYDFDVFKRLYDAAYSQGAGKTWYALDNDKNIHAAIFVFFDNKSASYLISSTDSDFRNSGSPTLLVRDSIIYVSKYTKRFDLEGSMMRGVEYTLRKFGGVQKPYFRITMDSVTLVKKIIMAGREKLLGRA